MMGRLGTLLLVVAVALTGAGAQTDRSFASPEEVVRALIDIVKKGDVDALLRLFGTDGEQLIASSDPATARRNREVFTIAVKEQWRLEENGPDKRTLVIGYEDWPFPVGLVKVASGWQFDTAAGKEEILARRIGRNELAAIATSRAYVTAQRRYAQAGHDGRPAGLFARTFASSPGMEDGLYWPTSKGQKRSPLGDLVAQAAIEGRPLGAGPSHPSPHNGYLFRILFAQGPAAPGGAKNYVIGGKMSGGFALVAWPAEYDQSGVMTFLVNQEGTVYEKDLGPATGDLGRSMTLYNPDSTWHRVE